MNFVLSSAAVVGLIGAGIGAALGLLFRNSIHRLSFFRLFLLIAIVPYTFHAYWTYRYSVGWIDLEVGPEPIGRYSGSTAFAIAALVVALLSIVLALWLASRVALMSALYPALLFTTYFNLALPLLQWQAPFDGPILDNMPNIWLFLLLSGCTIAFIAYAWIALPKWVRHA